MICFILFLSSIISDSSERVNVVLMLHCLCHTAAHGALYPFPLLLKKRKIDFQCLVFALRVIDLMFNDILPPEILQNTCQLKVAQISICVL